MKTSTALFLLGLLNVAAMSFPTRDISKEAFMVMAVVLICTSLVLQKLEGKQ